MPIALICNEGQGKTDSLERHLSDLSGWNIHSSMVRGFLPPIDDTDKDPYDLHFIIFAKKLDTETCKELYDLRHRMPFTFIIYYYRSLLDNQFMLLTEMEVNSCIIGIHRKNFLREFLP